MLKHSHLPTVFLVLAILTAACTGSHSQDQQQASVQESESETAEQPDPCAILSDDVLNRFFDTEGKEINRAPGKYSQHPLCIVTWPKPNAAEIEAEKEERMMEYMKAKMLGGDVETPSFRTTEEVNLTINSPGFDSKQSASNGFANAMRIMREGITVEVDGKEHSSGQYETEPVEGVGDDAVWIPKLNQLSVLSGKTIFHVGVILGKDKSMNLEKAKALSRYLTQSLN